MHLHLNSNLNQEWRSLCNLFPGGGVCGEGAVEFGCGNNLQLERMGLTKLDIINKRNFPPVPDQDSVSGRTKQSTVKNNRLQINKRKDKLLLDNLVHFNVSRWLLQSGYVHTIA